MADTDFKSSLPVRSEIDGTDERVHVKVVDGTNNPAINQMKVDSDNAAKVLATGHDPSGTNRTVRTSELGALTPDGVYSVTNNTKPGNTGTIVSSRTATPGDTTQTIRATGIQGSTDTTKWSQDVAIQDSNGNAFTTTNPLPITIVDAASGVTIINSEVDALNIAAGSSSNMDYTITASKTLSLKYVMCSGSGRMRFELQTSTDGVTFSRLMVKYNSTSMPNVDFDLSNNYKMVTGSGSKIRIVALNLDHQPFDAHTLFSGSEQ